MPAAEYSRAFAIAAATLLPPFRPKATMAGMPNFSQVSQMSSFASTTFTKPTGTPITSAGRSPSSMSCERRMSAVGALPTANTAFGCSRAAFSMEMLARVTPVSFAAAATSASAI